MGPVALPRLRTTPISTGMPLPGRLWLCAEALVCHRLVDTWLEGILLLANSMDKGTYDVIIHCQLKDVQFHYKFESQTKCLGIMETSLIKLLKHVN